MLSAMFGLEVRPAFGVNVWVASRRTGRQIDDIEACGHIVNGFRQTATMLEAGAMRALYGELAIPSGRGGVIRRHLVFKVGVSVGERVSFSCMAKREDGSTASNPPIQEALGKTVRGGPVMADNVQNPSL